MRPENMQELNVSLYRNTAVRRIEDLSTNLKHQIKLVVLIFTGLHVMRAQMPQTPLSCWVFFLRGVNFQLTENFLIFGVSIQLVFYR